MRTVVVDVSSVVINVVGGEDEMEMVVNVVGGGVGTVVVSIAVRLYFTIFSGSSGMLCGEGTMTDVSSQSPTV